MVQSCSSRRTAVQRGFLPFLFVLALGLASSPHALAAIFTVTKTADTADGTCDADCSLREAVIAANGAVGADTIVVPAGTYALTLVGASEDASATGDLDITDSVTINGAGSASTIVDGNGTDRVFHVLALPPTITISGLTIRNGSVTGFGGGVHAPSDVTVNLQNCVISNNTASGFGGGVNKQGFGQVNLLNCTVSNNSASGFGGGINNNDGGSVNVDFSVVQSNRAVGFGGGLNNNSSGGALTVRDSTVASNTAAGFGGGGINNNSNGNTLVLRSSITGNSAQNGGGINNNSTGPLTVGETLIAGNTALGTIGGGGILNNSTGTFTLFQSTVSGNSSAGFGGGGIDSNSSGTVNITNSTISGNSTTGSNGGGGVYKNSSAAISMTSVTITGNSSTNGGSNIHDNSAGGSLSLLNSIVANPVGGSNCGGDPITSNGFNLASDASCNLVAAGDLQNTNPLLGALANNGGLTPTHALLIGSPAIDAGTAAGGSVDQRGVARPVGAGFDIGAFEGTGAAPPPPATAQAIPTLSDWALILLSLLIGGTALTRFGRRRG